MGKSDDPLPFSVMARSESDVAIHDAPLFNDAPLFTFARTRGLPRPIRRAGSVSQ